MSATFSRRFPFSAIVGQEDARLALLLAAIDPGIGGVLLRGDKGSAKSTLARGLAALLAPTAPFIELPVGATEDRVVGGLDVTAALSGEAAQLRPGLLAAAHGGVLYVDEVNLLPDHLVNLLLDAAASGIHHVERDGVSHTEPARFVLIGSMNPEEGELRPQLLDRFGLAVEVLASGDFALRAEAVKRRLAFERGEKVVDEDPLIAGRLADARPAQVPDRTVDFACRLALAVGAEGLRADLVLCRAAAALAGWEGRDLATTGDVERVAGLALAHRRRRRPFDPPTLPTDELRRAVAEVLGEDDRAGEKGTEDSRERVGSPVSETERASDTRDGRWSELAGEAFASSPAPLNLPPPRRSRTAATGPNVPGPAIGYRPPGAGVPSGIAVGATLRASLLRRGADPVEAGPNRPVVAAEDLRETVRRRSSTRCIVLAVDTSGSMGSRTRVEAATGAVLGLLGDAYRMRHRVALVAFRGDSAEVVLAPTASVEIARTRLADLPTGGSTPLAEGLEAAFGVATRAVDEGDEPMLALLTDGRATAGPGALDRALAASAEVAAAGVRALVLDAEDGVARLSLARSVADALGAPCIPMADLSAASVEAAIRSNLEARR
ncbi:MAG: AAA family ATPase [Acidimicrobiales bacterium]